jgi:recombinational DNA repair ATPase RecF
VRIRRLRIAHWRGVGESDVAFGDGVTIVAGPNETGKSSLIEALLCLFRYPDDSRHRELEAVRPVHVDAAPSVRLEAELGELRIDYEKHYGKAAKSRSTRLRISAPGRNEQTLTGRDAHDRAEALLGEHIDRELWQALQIEQGTGIAQAKLNDRQGLQAALDAAAGADGGLGAEDSSLFERVQAEYERYFTPTSGKPRGEFASLPGQVAEAEAGHRALLVRIAELQGVTDQHQALQRRRQDMARRLPEIETQARAHEAAWRRVQGLHEALEQSALALRAARLVEQQLAGERDGRIEQAKDIGILGAQILDHERALQQADAALGEQRTALQGLRADHDRIAQARDGAAARQRDCQAALDLAQHERERARVAGVLDKVAALDEQIDRAQAVVDGIAVEDDDLGVLRELQQRQFRAAAAAEAASPAVRIEALRDLDLVVRGTNRRLAAGETLTEPVSAGFAVAVPGLLALSVSSTDEIQALADKARAAQAALGERLQALRVGSLVEAEARLGDTRAARGRVEALRAQRADWLGRDSVESLKARASALAADADALASRLQGVELPGGEEALREALREAATAEQQAGAELDALQARREPLEQGIRTRGEQRAGLVVLLEADRQRLALAQQKLDAARDRRGDADLEQALERARAACADAERAHRERQAAYEGANPARVQLLAENAEAALARQRNELDQLREQLIGLEGRLAQARGEALFDQLGEAEARTEQLQAALARVTRRATAARRLRDVVGEHRAAASRRYVQPLKERIDALGRLVFNGSFSVEIDDALAIVNRSLDGVTVPFESLSIGAQEQVGILARLAAAELVGEHAHVPLLMDDTLGYADEDRLATMGVAIAKVARDNQVIILTCMPSRFAYIGNATTVSV